MLKLTLTTVDETVYEVSTIFADLIRYDVLRSKHGFPPRDGSEFLFMGLVAFCALVRTGKVPAGTSVDEFLNTVATIEPTEAEEAAEFPAATDN